MKEWVAALMGSLDPKEFIHLHNTAVFSTARFQRKPLTWPDKQHTPASIVCKSKSCSICLPQRSSLYTIASTPPEETPAVWSCEWKSVACWCGHNNPDTWDPPGGFWALGTVKIRQISWLWRANAYVTWGFGALNRQTVFQSKGVILNACHT